MPERAHRTPVPDPSEADRAAEDGGLRPAADAPEPVVGEAPVQEEALDFQSVYRENVAFVWRTASALGVPAQELEDITQDVFVVVHRKLPEFQGRSKVRTWIYAVLRRTLLDRQRTAARRQMQPLASEPADDPAHTPEQQVARREAQLALQQILENLSYPQREVFVMVDIQHMSPQETAEMLGVSANTVYSRLRAARSHVERLAQRLANLEEWRKP